MTAYTIYTDGAARGNPGPAGAGGAIIDSNGNEVATVCKYLGEITNNQAEYQAFILALEKAIDLGATNIKIFADSELIVRQIKREYRIKNKGLKPLFEKAQELLKKIGQFEIIHIRREENKRADQLANLAIDGQEL